MGPQLTRHVLVVRCGACRRADRHGPRLATVTLYLGPIGEEVNVTIARPEKVSARLATAKVRAAYEARGDAAAVARLDGGEMKANRSGGWVERFEGRGVDVRCNRCRRTHRLKRSTIVRSLHALPPSEVGDRRVGDPSVIHVVGTELGAPDSMEHSHAPRRMGTQRASRRQP